MDTLISMKVFAAVVDTGSFAAASDRLGMSRAMTSKYVAYLEEHLGTRLLQRTTRKLTLTESGATYYERCVLILADLAQHNCLTYAYATSGDEWRMTGTSGRHAVRVSGSLRATNGDMLKLAALGGAGVIRQPMFLVGPELRDGRLVEVLKGYKSDDIGIYAVYPSRKHLSAKVRAFVDFLSAAFARKTGW